ncbi:MAG TPA: glucokinase [Fontimonas sp.]
MTAIRSVLVADIGGTNARFALARHEGGQLQLSDIRVLAVEEHPTLQAAAQAYLRSAGASADIRTAVFAVASAVSADQIKLTNSPWSFSIRALQTELRMPDLRIVNDFAALSMALPHLLSSDLDRLGQADIPARIGQERSYATLGPGTGLGVGGLRLANGRGVVIESEGGHAGFAPSSDFEMAILKFLLGKYERVSNERLLCGAGLVNLYEAICAIEGAAADHNEPQFIVAEAEEKSDSVADRTVETFCALLGAVAGDVALTLGAWDGVYLGGGIAQKLAARLQRSTFRARFEAKGRHAPLMQRIPTWNILHPAVGLLGAAAFATQA